MDKDYEWYVDYCEAHFEDLRQILIEALPFMFYDDRFIENFAHDAMTVSRTFPEVMLGYMRTFCWKDFMTFVANNPKKV